jgi:hypothetical protein
MVLLGETAMIETLALLAFDWYALGAIGCILSNMLYERSGAAQEDPGLLLGGRNILVTSVFGPAVPAGIVIGLAMGSRKW